MKHKHAELIKAWADGATIEVRDYGNSREWEETTHPMWCIRFEYRIKPEPKPDVVSYIYARGGHFCEERYGEHHNLKLTFDGETGKLKAAEVIE